MSARRLAQAASGRSWFSRNRWLLLRRASQLAILALFGPIAAMLSYLMAALAMPLQDSLLSGADLMLGFDWIGWYKTVAERPRLEQVLGLLY